MSIICSVNKHMSASLTRNFEFESFFFVFFLCVFFADAFTIIFGGKKIAF